MPLDQGLPAHGISPAHSTLHRTSVLYCALPTPVVLQYISTAVHCLNTALGEAPGWSDPVVRFRGSAIGSACRPAVPPTSRQIWSRHSTASLQSSRHNTTSFRSPACYSVTCVRNYVASVWHNQAVPVLSRALSPKHTHTHTQVVKSSVSVSATCIALTNARYPHKQPTLTPTAPHPLTSSLQHLTASQSQRNPNCSSPLFFPGCLVWRQLRVHRHPRLQSQAARASPTLGIQRQIQRQSGQAPRSSAR
eukprot:2795475-Rhodomonas_salina.1